MANVRRTGRDPEICKPKSSEGAVVAPAGPGRDGGVGPVAAVHARPFKYGKLPLGGGRIR